MLSLESLQIRRNHNSLKSLSFFFSPALRSWMDVHWHGKEIEVGTSEVHEAIVRAGFRKIYTTNFDRWIEKACDHWQVKYRKILTVKDLTARQQGELEIGKIPR